MNEIEEQISSAFQIHVSGDLARAGEQYAVLLNQVPKNPQLLYLLGTLRYQLGDLPRAHDFLEQAIAIDSSNVQARMNFALVLQDEGFPDAAIEQLEAAIRSNTSIPEIHNNLAVLLLAADRLDEAKKSCRNALSLRDNYPEALTNLGLIYKQERSLDTAEDYFRQAISANAQHVDALSNLGALLCEQKRYSDALPFLQQAVSLSPSIIDPYFNLGKVFARLKRSKEAEEQLNIALQLNPLDVNVLEEKSDLLSGVGRFAEAQATLFVLLSQAPEKAGGWFRLAASLLSVNLVEEAQRAMAEGERIDNDSVLSHFFRGFFFFRVNKIQEALQEYNLGLEKDADNPLAHWNRALAHLLLGQFKEGFDDFEYRFYPDSILGPHPYTEPQWDGSQLNGEALLVHSEQGFGDILQFMRYMKYVQERGANIIFNSGQPVYKLLVGDDEEDLPISNTESPDPAKSEPLSYQFQIPLLSLPKVFGTTVNTIPWDGPYVSASEKRVAIWKKRLSPVSAFKIGIVWGGNPEHKNDHNRSCRLSEFALLGRIPGVRWYVLQKGKSLSQAYSPIENMEFEILDKDIADFSDTAAVIENLDLVISVDTSVTHLAGAMGKPVWTILPFSPDWRWMMDREDTPWYPSMRLFRQDAYGDWPSVFRKAHDALMSLVCANKNSLDEVSAKCLDAYVFAQAGNVDTAIECCRELLAAEENLSSAAFKSIATIAIQTKSTHELLPLFDGRTEQEASSQAARIRFAVGNEDEALGILNNARTANTLQLADYLVLGERYFDRLDYQQAIDVFQEAASKWPNTADVHFHLGRTLQRVSQNQEAMAAYEKALEIDVSHPRATNNLAVLYFGDENFDKANKLLQPLVLANTSFAFAWANLGRVCARSEQKKLAEIYLRRALELSPDLVFVHVELGAVLFDQGRMEEALSSLNTAVSIDPNDAGAWASLASVYWHSGDIERAKQTCLHCLSLDSKNVLAHTTLSWCYLPTRDYNQGWREYEWRFRDVIESKRRKSAIPRWNGEEIKGRRLLVHTEQGFGDAFQFLRFLPKLEGVSVTLECQDDLISVVCQCPYVGDVIPWSKSVRMDASQFDVEVPLMSLPYVLQLGESDLGMSEPYLFTPADRLEKWKQRLADYKDFRVGLVWAGNPKHANDRRRSCKLADFAPLAAIPGVTFFSLQKGQPSEQGLQPPQGMAFVNLAPELQDFLDTAAVIEQLDLLIAVDTSVVHLAGALGRPVWTLLPTAPDWRWLLDCEDSPWYPSARLFRQRERGDWAGVMERVADALSLKVKT